MADIDTSKAHRLFYPEVPAILCASHADRISAMPVVSYISLSGSPPLVGISCSPGGTTLRLAAASGMFSLCWLDKKYANAVSFLASHSGKKLKDKIAASGLSHGRGPVLDVPLILDSAASLECKLVESRKFGDHVLLVGKIACASASEDFREYWQFRNYAPILYTGWQGGLATYQGLTSPGDRPKPRRRRQSS